MDSSLDGFIIGRWWKVGDGGWLVRRRRSLGVCVLGVQYLAVDPILYPLFPCCHEVNFHPYQDGLWYCEPKSTFSPLSCFSCLFVHNKSPTQRSFSSAIPKIPTLPVLSEGSSCRIMRLLIFLWSSVWYEHFSKRRNFFEEHFIDGNFPLKEHERFCVRSPGISQNHLHFGIPRHQSV
jgi:hypothetical protein